MCMYVCVYAYVFFRARMRFHKFGEIVWKSRSGCEIFAGMFVLLRSRVLYGFYEAKTHIILGPRESQAECLFTPRLVNSRQSKTRTR